MAKTAQLERTPEEPPDPQCDLELLRALKEQLESARAVSLAPMVMLKVTLTGRPLRLHIGMSVEQAQAVEDSGLGRQEVMLDDVKSDPRAPDFLAALGLGAIMSTPIVIDERFVGALHVADTRVRDFSHGQSESIAEIAHIISKRLEYFLGPEREERRESLMRRAVSPAFAELRNALVPLNLGTSDLRIVAADLLPLVNRISSSCDEEDKVAARAYEDLASLIEEIARASARVREVVMVVEGMWGEGGRNQSLGDLLQVAGGLALHSTRLVGGVDLPKVPPEYSVRARRSVAVAGLSLMLSRAAESNVSGVGEVTSLGVELVVEQECFTLQVCGKNLSAEDCGRIGAEVEMLLLGDTDLSVHVEHDQICMRLTRG